MPAKKSRYYNDPSIGEAFNNLASMFKPPSAAELSAYANARATREKAQRAAELYEYAKRPGYNWETADRMGVGAAARVPNQDYYSVDQSTATSRAPITRPTMRANCRQGHRSVSRTARTDGCRDGE